MKNPFRRMLATNDGNLSPNEIFPSIDLDQISRELHLESEGVSDGRKDHPHSLSKDLDAQENRIVAEIEKIRRYGLSRFEDHQRVYRERLGSVDGIDNNIRDAVRKMEIDFKAEILRRHADLQDASEDFHKVENELGVFRENNRIGRTAHSYKGFWPWLAVTLVIVLIESAFNGVFFADANVMGIAGGTLIALAISVINVASASLFGSLFRYANHIHVLKKIFGSLMMICGIALALSGNYFVGLVRDAAETVSVAEAPGIVIERIADGQYLMESLDAWLLAALGIVVATIAGWKSYTVTDPYPGYGRVWKKFINKRDELRDIHEETINELIKKRDEAIEELRHQRDEAEGRIENATAAYQGLVALEGKLVPFLKECDDAANRLITIYRDANRKVRTTPEPAYFSDSFAFRYAPRMEPSETATHPPDDEAIARFHKLVETAINGIGDECGNAIEECSNAVAALGTNAAGGTTGLDGTSK